MLSRTVPSLLRKGRLQPLSLSAAQLSTLVIAEHKGGSLAPASLQTVSAASALGDDITVLVAGLDVSSVVEAASRVQGVKRVLSADDASLEHQLAEPIAELVAAVHNNRNFSHIVTPAGTTGKNFLPRVAALLGVQQVSEVMEIVSNDTYVRPIYAGNALQTVKVTGSGPQLLTVRATSFDAAGSSAAGPAPSEAVSEDELKAAKECRIPVEWVREEVRESTRPELGSARVVISGGRALKSRENFEMLERLADRLGGAVGASRAAVDAGYAPNDLQVGQTGKVVAPELYVAVGISGAIQHLAGMKDAKTIVAINTDADAPIFQVADYGLVMDLFKALPELEQELSK